MPEDINPPSSASKGSESQGPEFGILDGTQAAYLYGVFDDYEEGSQSFSAIGIEIALRYLRKKGIKAKAMLHEGREKDEKSKPVIDRLKKKNLIEFIPKDKYYEKLFSYGVGNKCYIFSTAREEIEKHAKDESAEEFLEEHLIPFAFFRNDFRLNPNPSRIGSSVFRGRTKPISDKKPNEKVHSPNVFKCGLNYRFINPNKTNLELLLFLIPADPFSLISPTMHFIFFYLKRLVNETEAKKMILKVFSQFLPILFVAAPYLITITILRDYVCPLAYGISKHPTVVMAT